MGLLVVGSVALDTVASPAGKREEALGGSAIYFSSAASYFAPVQLVGVVGEDFPWDEIEFLKERGVSVEGVETAPGKTFRWAGSYPEMGDAETLSTELNVFEHFRPKIPASYRNSRLVFLANIDPDLQLEVLSQVSEPELAACDTMNFWIDSKREQVFRVFSGVQMTFVNEAEAKSITGQRFLPTAVEEIHATGPRAVVVKKGEHGALLSLEGSVFSVPSIPLKEVRDPTGAGDSFAGGMMGYLMSQSALTARTYREALIYGTVMASFAVEDFSVGRLKALEMDEIEERANLLKDMISLL